MNYCTVAASFQALVLFFEKYFFVENNDLLVWLVGFLPLCIVVGWSLLMIQWGLIQLLSWLGGMAG